VSEQPAQPITRIDVPVTSDTTGFGTALRRKLEQETRGIEALVGVGLASTLKAREQLRNDIKKRVTEAAAGVAAVVSVQADADALKATLEKAAKEAAQGVVATVKVDADGTKLKAKIAAAAKAAGTSVRLTLEADGDVAAQAEEKAKEAQAAVRRTPVDVLVQARDRLTEGVAGAVARAKAFVSTTKAKIEVPVEAGQGFAGSGGLTGADGLLGVLGARSRIGKATKMVAALVAILSLVEPLVAGIVGSLGTLTAVVGSAGQAIGVLAGAPGILLALVSAVGAGIIAFKGFTGELDAMPPAMRVAAETVRSFAGDWNGLVKSVQTRFWSQFNEALRPTIEVFLPMLEDGLANVGDALGTFVADLLQYVQSPTFARDFPAAMKAAAYLTSGFGDALNGVVEWFFAATEAAVPFLDRVADGATAFGDWMRALLDTEEEREDFAS